MSKGKYPFTGTKSPGEDFSASSGDRVEDKCADPIEEDENAEFKDVVINYNPPEMEFEPTPFEFEQIKPLFVVKGERAEEKHSMVTEEPEPDALSVNKSDYSFANKIADNPIQTDVGLKKDWLKSEAHDFGPEEDMEE